MKQQPMKHAKKPAAKHAVKHAVKPAMKYAKKAVVKKAAMRHAQVRKQDLVRARISSVLMTIYAFINGNWKRQTTRALTMLLAIVMATVSTGEYLAPFVKTVVERNALKEGLVKQTFELTPETEDTASDSTSSEPVVPQGTDLDTSSDTAADASAAVSSNTTYLLSELSDVTVTLKGYMPEGATASAVDVTDPMDDQTTDGKVMAAYDITIRDGEEKFQPHELLPIKVEIRVPDLKRNDSIEIRHYKDNGSVETVSDYSVRNGRVVFNATGFSVYSIVDMSTDSLGEYHHVADVSELTEEQGFWLSYIGNNDERRFFSGDVNTGSTYKALYTNPNKTDSTAHDTAVWHFEKVGDEAKYKLYTLKNDLKNYITFESASGSRGYLGMTTDASYSKIVSFELTKTVPDTLANGVYAKTHPTTFSFKVSAKQSGKYYWLQASGTDGANGIRYWSDIEAGAISETKWNIYITYAEEESGEDVYHLDGKTFGIMNHQGGTVGHAMMDSSVTDVHYDMLNMKSLLVRHTSTNAETGEQTVTGVDTLYVAEDADITMWTFQNVEGTADRYAIFSDDQVPREYIKITDSGLVLTTDAAEATELTVQSNFDAGSTASAINKKIRFTYQGKAITFKGNDFGLETTSIGNAGQWMNLVERSTLSSSDYLTYYAEKVSISEPANDKNGPDNADVIIYTRVWIGNSYHFYAVNWDGSLYPVYERGDDIVWVSGSVDTLTWQFHEYRYANGEPTGYYYLYNPIGKTYLHPNLTNGTVIVRAKNVEDLNDVSVNMEGRMNGEYYSDILAWDDPQYSYIGLKADVLSGEKNLSPVKGANTDTFYFAKAMGIQDGLTEVPTVDNNEHGIVLKMVNWPAQSASAENASQYQNYLLGRSTWTEGTQYNTTTGILSTDLRNKDTGEFDTGEDAYPLVMHQAIGTVTPNSSTTAVAHPSLSVLYNEGYKEYTGTYRPTTTHKNTLVNHLFLQSTYDASGYFEYDSSQNFATLRKDDNSLNTQSDGSVNFTVYEDLATNESSLRDTMKHGQFLPYNTITAGSYSSKHPYNLTNIVGQLLPNDDPRKYESLHLVNGSPDYYNGMEMTATMTQSANGLDAWGHDIIFEFTGDDDFWFYVDGELVLDLGGIHSAVTGTVNFSTGDVIYYKADGSVKSQTKLYNVFYENCKKREMENNNKSEQEAEIIAANYADSSGIAKNGGFAEYSSHQIRAFYMERGAGASNLHMRFNLNNVKPGDVALTKRVTGPGNENINGSVVEYPYYIQYRINTNPDPEGEPILSEPFLLGEPDPDNAVNVTYMNSKHKIKFMSSYTPSMSTFEYRNVYMISPGRTAEVHLPDEAMYYRIVECGINEDIYDKVSIEGTPVSGTYENAEIEFKKKYYSTTELNAPGSTEDGWIRVTDMPSVVYENNLRPGALHTLRFTKHLYDSENHEISSDADSTTFNFRLYLSNGSTDDLNLVRYRDYYVTSPDDKICCWNVASQSFEEVNFAFIGEGEQAHYPSYYELTEEQKETVTFQTGPYGSITKIPAGYTVNVPNLLTSTKFKVEERDYEIPVGYTLIDTRDYDENGSIDREGYEVIRATETQATYEYVGMKNVGYVKSQFDPAMDINNERGYEITAEKVWNDADYVDSHDPVYFAVFIDRGSDGLELVEKTVRQISEPYLSARYYFSEVEDDDLSKYKVYEVKFNTGATLSVASDGTVTGWDSVTPHKEIDGFLQFKATPNTTHIEDTFNYSVEYEYGTPYSSAPGAGLANVKTDVVTNVRSGGIVVRLFDMKSWATMGIDPAGTINDETYRSAGKDLITNDYGLFTIKKGETTIGTFKSGRNGVITTLYDYDYNTDYTFIQEKVPAGYYGLQKQVVLAIVDPASPGYTGKYDSYSAKYDIALSNNNAPKWRYAHRIVGGGDDNLVAYIDLFNMPFSFDVVNVEQRTNKEINDNVNIDTRIPGIQYRLYDSLKSIDGTWVRNTVPMDDDIGILTTNADGEIVTSDNRPFYETLDPGTYYLEEITSAAGYLGFDDYIVFTIPKSLTDGITSDVDYNNLSATEDDDIIAANALDPLVRYLDVGKKEDNTTDTSVANYNERYPNRPTVVLTPPASVQYDATYKVTIEHRRLDLLPPILYIYNHVLGTFGDRTKDFNYIINITGANEGDKFWYYNGKGTKQRLENGGTISLKDSDYYVIGVDGATDANITVTLTPQTTPVNTQIPYALDSDFKQGYQEDNTYPVQAVHLNEQGKLVFNNIVVHHGDSPEQYTYTVNLYNTLNGIVPVGLFDISFVPYLIPLLIIIIVYVVILIRKHRNDDDDE